MSNSTALKIGRTNAGYLVRVEGRGTMRESPALRQFATECLEQDSAPIVVDLLACEYLDSTFLGCLVGIHNRSRKLPNSLTVVACADTRRRLLSATKLDTVLVCVESPPQPVGELVTLSGSELEAQEFGRHIMECHRRLSEISSPSAPAFRAIADQLERELGETPTRDL